MREFTDDGGRKWRAWDIRPEAIHPVTKAEDYLADCYVTGWVVFETVDGQEKRRLCPWPIRWMDESDRGLRKLLSKAEVVPPHRVRAQREEGVESVLLRTASPADVLEMIAEPDVTDLEVVRTFKYPGGRYWTVCVILHPEDGGHPRLRFTAGMRFIDLASWPKDWTDQPDDVLIDMLRRAKPRPQAASLDPGTPRRRWDDSPAAASPSP